MNIYPTERTLAFIDGPNLHATVRTLGFEIDYRKLLEHLRSQGHFLRVLYYTAIVEDQEFSTFRPLADWLDYNGYTMVTKPARGFTDSTGRRRFRTSMDVELAVDAMRLSEKADHIILFSGEQSFTSLVQALQQQGKRVTVISTIETQPTMISDDLRRQADQFIDIDSLQSKIARLGRTPRPPMHHAEREERFNRGAGRDDIDDNQGDNEPSHDDDDGDDIVHVAQNDTRPANANPSEVDGNPADTDSESTVIVDKKPSRRAGATRTSTRRPRSTEA